MRYPFVFRKATLNPGAVACLKALSRLDDRLLILVTLLDSTHKRVQIRLQRAGHILGSAYVSSAISTTGLAVRKNAWCSPVT